MRQSHYVSDSQDYHRTERNRAELTDEFAFENSSTFSTPPYHHSIVLDVEIHLEKITTLMPNPVYTLKEKQEWLKYYHQGESPEMASKHFHRVHPDRPKPSKNTIRAALKRFEDTGRFDRSEPYTQPRKAVPLEKRILVCAAVEAGGGCASASNVARQFDLSESSVRKIWKEEGFGDGKLKRITIGNPRKKVKNTPIKVPDCSMIEEHWLAALTNGHVNDKEPKSESECDVKPVVNTSECVTAGTKT